MRLLLVTFFIIFIHKFHHTNLCNGMMKICVVFLSNQLSSHAASRRHRTRLTSFKATFRQSDRLALTPSVRSRQTFAESDSISL
jgi:hypothetical protein